MLEIKEYESSAKENRRQWGEAAQEGDCVDHGWQCPGVGAAQPCPATHQVMMSCALGYRHGAIHTRFSVFSVQPWSWFGWSFYSPAPDNNNSLSFCNKLFIVCHWILKIFILLLDTSVLCACMYVYHVHTVSVELRRWCQTPWNWSDRWWAIMWVLRTECRSSWEQTVPFTAEPSHWSHSTKCDSVYFYSLFYRGSHRSLCLQAQETWMF